MDSPLASRGYGAGGLGSGPRLSLSERVYAGLLRVYPRAFRARYRDEMVVLFGDQLRDARSGRGQSSVAATWTRTLIDLARSAVGEHLRRDRTMAQSLATFEPTRSMRLLGLLGVIGSLLLLAAFLTFDPFEDRAWNTVRLAWFGLAGMMIALAFYPRQAAARPRLAFVATAVVGIVGASYTLLTVQSVIVAFANLGPFGIDAAFWLSAAFYGAAMLWIDAAWRGMSRLSSMATKLGATLLLGSVVAWAGDDRFHLVDDAVYGDLVSVVAQAGVVMNGIGWLLLGGVLLVADRSRRTDP